MKAIRIHQRGGADDLVYEDAPRPQVPPGYALVRVFATGITPTELTWGETYENCEGTPRLPSIPGHEVAGVVEEINGQDSGIKVGDSVYGLTEFCRDGSAAEYVAVRAADLAPKPRTLDYAEAAAVPLSALTAWQALVVRGGLSKGQRVLIHGAAGGVGTYAVQLAHLYGAHVIATASLRNAPFLHDLGADEVVDYASNRFEDKIKDVDVVLDAIGGDTLERSWGVLRRGGVLVTLTASLPPEKPAQYGVRGIFFIVTPSREQLTKIGALIDSGSLKVIIQKILSLDRAREAFLQALSGHNRGKIVLRVKEEEARAA